MILACVIYDASSCHIRYRLMPNMPPASTINGMRCELREFNEGEMQAFDDLITVLVVHDAVVVDEFRSIMRKDIIYQVERIHRLKFAVFSSLFSLTHIEL